MQKREFTISDEYLYNRSGAVCWIVAHILRYPWLPVATVILAILGTVCESANRLLVGHAFDLVLGPDAALRPLMQVALAVLAVGLGQGLAQLARNMVVEVLAQRFERDARDELYLNLLGKSLTFHGRQRIGDVMARATNDVRQLNMMVNPGFSLIFASFLGLVVPIATIALNLPRVLLITPAAFLVLFAVTLRRYMKRLEPVVELVRERFGLMNARLAEAVSGIEVVKGAAQEAQEQHIFSGNARACRDAFVEQGQVQARYLPLLAYSLAVGGGFLHAMLLVRQGALSVGQVVSYMGLLNLLGFPSFISMWSFSLVQLGVASARRILALINAESELDENPHGLSRRLQGEIVFDHVSFGYGGTPVLRDISFTARPGETIAIVGQTGSGKTTLTRLVNRTYDVTAGRVLVDAVDVRQWNVAALRSQISTIEQDVFLFSRSIAENIAFGAQGAADKEAIERAAREAQAHEFITGFAQGYNTEIGERGVKLSGGQRQRLAIARAFLTDPRILILDDSTSAIDSATEDQIQRAMRRIMRGRTTLLITHRLSQIRWADRILVLRRGELVDQGSHEALLARCEAYRRIFARYAT
ncbi:MAG TPA: ABC transporter ATP-binding protein [Anaerolineae bacterium]|nr:ABC transporter ATP-binding protein [Anaerolineae bacterium]